MTKSEEVKLSSVYRCHWVECLLAFYVSVIIFFYLTCHSDFFPSSISGQFIFQSCLVCLCLSTCPFCQFLIVSQGCVACLSLRFAYSDFMSLLSLKKPNCFYYAQKSSKCFKIFTKHLSI